MKLKELIIKNKEVLLYLVFGVLTTLVNIFSYHLLAKTMHIDYLISTVLAWILSVLFAYVTNRQFVFQNKSKNILKEMISFFGFRLLSGGIDLFNMYFFVDIIKMNDMVVKILSNVLVIILNYVFSKLFVFTKKDGNNKK